MQPVERLGLAVDRDHPPAVAQQLRRVATGAAAEIDGQTGRGESRHRVEQCRARVVAGRGEVASPRPPGLIEHAEPVAVRDLRDVLIAEPRAQELDETRQPRRTPELVRQRRALEVGAERHVLDADPRRDVVDMADDGLDRRGRVGGAVGAQEAHAEVDADDAAGLADRVELIVRQVARRGAQGVRVRVRRDERRKRERRDVPEPRLVQMREVDEDAEAVAGVHELPPRVCEPGPRIRRRGELERHTLGECVRPRPDEADRAHAALVPALEIGEIGGEWVGAFEVHDRGDPSRNEVAHAPRQRQPEPFEDDGELLRDPRGLLGRNRIVERKCIRRPQWFHHSPVTRHVKREEATRKPGARGGREIDVSRCLATPGAQHEVVVAVEDHRITGAW